MANHKLSKADLEKIREGKLCGNVVDIFEEWCKDKNINSNDTISLEDDDNNSLSPDEFKDKFKL